MVVSARELSTLRVRTGFEIEVDMGCEREARNECWQTEADEERTIQSRTSVRYKKDCPHAK